MTSIDAARVLLIEDDPIDAQLFRRTAKKQELDVSIDHASDGAAGLEALRQQSSDPCVIVLDLNMHGMNGHDFLNELRADPRLKRAIVFVLSSSNHTRDIARAYDRNVAGYFNKDDINELIPVIRQYVEIVRFPSLSS